MNTGICYIFGAGDRTLCHIELTEEDLVIAADGGFDYLEEIGLRADCVLGDFDSVESYNLPSDCIRYPRKKDDTDMMLAARLGLDKGYTEFRIYGGLGGRLDHTLGNIQVLTYLSRQGAMGTLIGDTYSLRVVTDSVVTFGKDLPENRAGNLCSVFSLSDVSVNVTIQGLEYEVEGTTLTNSFPLGISNEFTGRKGIISVQKGTLAVLWQH
ncbi:MAG: thiamine diphosphokinase [Eubacterium sp.]|nr:thiamine diphosphokinase [Eubacterium sp.]